MQGGQSPRARPPTRRAARARPWHGGPGRCTPGLPASVCIPSMRPEPRAGGGRRPAALQRMRETRGRDAKRHPATHECALVCAPAARAATRAGARRCAATGACARPCPQQRPWRGTAPASSSARSPAARRTAPRSLAARCGVCNACSCCRGVGLEGGQAQGCVLVAEKGCTAPCSSRGAVFRHRPSPCRSAAPRLSRQCCQHACSRADPHQQLTRSVIEQEASTAAKAFCCNHYDGPRAPTPTVDGSCGPHSPGPWAAR
jgi:hypothetical protein